MDYNMNNNYGYNNFGYMAGGPSPYMGQPWSMNPAAAVTGPANVNALTEEEIKMLQHKKPSKIDINISEEDQLRSMCTHKHNGCEVTQELNDGSGKVYCPICGEIWKPTGELNKEDIQGAIDIIDSAMQTAKWVGDYNIELVRDYFPIAPLLKKFPDLYEHAMTTYKKFINQNGYDHANSSHLYSMYNQLTGNYGVPAGMGYNNPYIQQAPQYQYGQQVPNVTPYQPQQVPQQYPYAQQQPMAPIQNPMQLPMGSQFGEQANNMMNGGYYAQPQQYPYGQMPQQQMPQYQYGQAPQQAQPGVNDVTQQTTTDAVTGEVTSETTVNLA